MNLIQSIILGIIEGITEFLPISSTGHMILASKLLLTNDQDYTKTFEIVIQFAAILAVFTLYYKRFLVSINIYTKLAVAFLPTGLVGVVAYKYIKEYLMNPFVVCLSLIIGGVVLIILDKWSEKKKSEYISTEDISYKGAFIIGCIQCISMIPGVSRAAATIFGGIFKGFDRKQAAEFSFLLAIPTMTAATGYDLFKHHEELSAEKWSMLAIGGVVAFIFAFIAVKAFINFLTLNGFKYFGLYRIILGVIFLILALVFNWQIDK